jgi:hypothetical protein
VPYLSISTRSAAARITDGCLSLRYVFRSSSWKTQKISTGGIKACLLGGGCDARPLPDNHLLPTEHSRCFAARAGRAQRTAGVPDLTDNIDQRRDDNYSARPSLRRMKSPISVMMAKWPKASPQPRTLSPPARSRTTPLRLVPRTRPHNQPWNAAPWWRRSTDFSAIALFRYRSCIFITHELWFVNWPRCRSGPASPLTTSRAADGLQ